MRLIGLVLLFPLGLAAQNKSPVSPKINGTCNGTAIGSDITVTVKCEEGLTATQAKQLAQQYSAILRQVKKENLSFDDVISRLKTLQNGVDSIASSVKNRRLTAAQKTDLSSLASQTNFSKSDLIFTQYSDPEAATFAADFSTALGISPSVYIGMSTAPDIGITLSISKEDFDRQVIPPTCELLRQFFDRAGISFKGERQSGVPTGRCKITVGLKPPSN